VGVGCNKEGLDERHDICVGEDGSTFPRQKQNVTNIIKPREPLMTTVHIIARGNVSEASLISSDI
jgi:hypothetical protein